MTHRGCSRCLPWHSGPTVLPSTSWLATHPFLWPMVRKPSYHSILQRQLTFCPLNIPTSTETLIAYYVTQLLKCPEDLCDMADRILCAQKSPLCSFWSVLPLLFETMTLPLALLSLCETPMLRKSSTGRLSRNIWAPWLLSIIPRGAHTSSPRWMAPFHAFAMQPSTFFHIFLTQWTIFPPLLLWQQKTLKTLTYHLKTFPSPTPHGLFQLLWSWWLQLFA